MTTRQSVSSDASVRLAPWLGISAIVILLDQISKIAISRMFSFGESFSIAPFFNLVLAHNKGAAFSFLAAESGWQRYFFTAIGIVAAFFIIHLLRRNIGHKLMCWALALILGGAIGNVIDRLLYGHVIDFLDFHVNTWHWPAFNIADSAICVGAALFVFDELRRNRK